MKLSQYGMVIDGVTWVDISPILSSVAISGDMLSDKMSDDTRNGFFSALVTLADVVAEIERELDPSGA